VPQTAGPTEEPELLPPVAAPKSALAGGWLVAAGSALAAWSVLVAGDPPAPPEAAVLASADPAALIARIDERAEAERRHAFAALRLDPAEKARAERFVREGELEIGWIVLLDSMDPDGDTVRVSSAGFSQELVVTERPQRLAVPFKRGGSVALTGVRDGQGGGITVAVLAGSGPIALRPLGIGDTVEIAAP
jgi:hypothetical protein